jgi:hypothetical protein
MANADYKAESARKHPTLQSPSLRIAINAAMRRHGIAPTRFGREAVRDPRFVLDIMNFGREVRPTTDARVRAYIDSLDGEGAR